MQKMSKNLYVKIETILSLQEYFKRKEYIYRISSV